MEAPAIMTVKRYKIFNIFLNLPVSIAARVGKANAI